MQSINYEALFPASSIADRWGILRGKDLTWRFPRIKRGPNLAESCSSGKGKEEWEGAAAKGPSEDSTASG